MDSPTSYFARKGKDVFMVQTKGKRQPRTRRSYSEEFKQEAGMTRPAVSPARPLPQTNRRCDSWPNSVYRRRYGQRVKPRFHHQIHDNLFFFGWGSFLHPRTHRQDEISSAAGAALASRRAARNRKGRPRSAATICSAVPTAFTSWPCESPRVPSE